MNQKNVFHPYKLIMHTLIALCFVTSSGILSSSEKPKASVKDINSFIWNQLAEEFERHKKEEITGDTYKDAAAIDALCLVKDEVIFTNVVAKLTAQGFDLNVRNSQGETALHQCHPLDAETRFFSRLPGHSKAKVLLLAGAKITDDSEKGLKDMFGHTAFNRATHHYRDHSPARELFNLYMEKGANPYELNSPCAALTLDNATPEKLPQSPLENMVMRNDFGSIALCFKHKKYDGDTHPLILATSIFCFDPELGSLVGEASTSGCGRTLEELAQGISFSANDLAAAIAKVQNNKKRYPDHKFLQATMHHTLLFLNATLSAKQAAQKTAELAPDKQEMKKDEADLD